MSPQSYGFLVKVFYVGVYGAACDYSQSIVLRDLEFLYVGV